MVRVVVSKMKYSNGRGTMPKKTYHFSTRAEAQKFKRFIGKEGHVEITTERGTPMRRRKAKRRSIISF